MRTAICERRLEVLCQAVESIEPKVKILRLLKIIKQERNVSVVNHRTRMLRPITKHPLRQRRLPEIPNIVRTIRGTQIYPLRF
jgi:hypothetical protein